MDGNSVAGDPFASKIAQDIVRCRECDRLGPRDMTSIASHLGICEPCGRKHEEHQRRMDMLVDGAIDRRKSPDHDFDVMEDEE